ncbi:hypothetical protein FRC14_006694 [Serendipita sp. 396]|nr:hypothetical protein FRC14_006694 [Serendipita sp. 396]
MRDHSDLIKILPEKVDSWEGSSSWNTASERPSGDCSNANMTIQWNLSKGASKFKVQFKWDGLSGDPKHLLISFDRSFRVTDKVEIWRDILRGWLNANLTMPAPGSSSVSGRLRVRFEEFDPTTNESKMGNLLRNKHFVDLKTALFQGKGSRWPLLAGNRQ